MNVSLFAIFCGARGKGQPQSPSNPPHSIEQKKRELGNDSHTLKEITQQPIYRFDNKESREHRETRLGSNVHTGGGLKRHILAINASGGVKEHAVALPTRESAQKIDFLIGRVSRFIYTSPTIEDWPESIQIVRFYLSYLCLSSPIFCILEHVDNLRGEVGGKAEKNFLL